MKPKLALLAICLLLGAAAKGVQADGWVDTTLTVGMFPMDLCYNSQNDRVYCVCYFGTVFVIDGATNAIIATVQVGHEPAALCYNPTDNKVYAANNWGKDVSVIDGATNAVVATVGSGEFLYGLCYDPHDNRVYCSGATSDSVYVIDGAADSVVARVPAGGDAQAMCYNALTELLQSRLTSHAVCPSSQPSPPRGEGIPPSPNVKLDTRGSVATGSTARTRALAP